MLLSSHEYRSGKVQQVDLLLPEPGMLTELAPGVFWLRMPLPMALNHINLYMLEDEDGWCVIDTGMHLPDTLDLWEQLLQRYCDNKPVTRVLVTHMHPDHVGNAGWLCERFRCPLLMSEPEYFAARSYSTTSELGWQAEVFYRRAGLGDDYIDFLRGRVGFGGIVAPIPSAYQRLNDSDNVIAAGVKWQVIIGRGHSFAHISLYSAELDILIAGDQLLPKISPNVSVMATEPLASPLNDWYRSLKALKCLPPHTLVLPAHNQVFYGLHERADELIEHHEQQLTVLIEACMDSKGQGLRPVDLLERLFGRSMSFADMGLAIGECKAHLHLLVERGQMAVQLIDDVEFYCTVV